MERIITSYLKYIWLLLFTVSWISVKAQIRIGTSTNPVNPGASLEVIGASPGNNSYSGLLLPRVPLINYATWTLAGDPTDGMVVFNTATTTGKYAVTPGVYCWYNFHWNRQSQDKDPAIISSIDCQQGTSPTGTYYATIALTSDNTKQISITPSSAGAYSITTNTVNGYSFAASGAFTTAQVGVPQPVTLQGTGIPQAAGTNSFTLTVDSQTCTFDVTILNSIACTGPLNGTYQVNKPLDATNTKQITFTPSVAGPYSATTNVVNGYSFSATGTFTQAQVGLPQIITLQATGTPQTTLPTYSSGTNTFIVTIAAQTCTFNVTVLPFVDCSGPVAGTYKVNVPLDASNTKQITIVPKSAGNYHFLIIFFYEYNGLSNQSFSLVGDVTFTAAQVGIPQTVILSGTGETPQKAGTFSGALQVFSSGQTNAIGCYTSVTVVP